MTDKTSNAMWGGRFASGPDAIMEAINASIGFDQRLASQDIAGSRAHAAMLAAVGILSDKDAEAIREGLSRVLEEIEGGTFRFSTALEDIHMNATRQTGRWPRFSGRCWGRPSADWTG
jgi:argininosuccinate lyase